jgi:hypothetical protein
LLVDAPRKDVIQHGSVNAERTRHTSTRKNWPGWSVPFLQESP